MIIAEPDIDHKSAPFARAATMLDVANVAGVSIKSVSRVINREPHVSARLRERVNAAIATLDYVPDPAARSLASARNFVLGLLFDNPSPNYTIKVQAGVYRACVEAGYQMRIDSLDSTQPDDRIAEQLRRLLRHGRPDGFIVTPPLTDSPVILDALDRLKVRYVRIAPASFPGRSPSISMDDAGAAAAVARMLWDLGHRRIAIVNGPVEHGAAGLRREGFMSRLRDLAPALAIIEKSGDFTFAGGIAAGRALFGAGHSPTAIFATNDDMAAGIMVACAEYGLKVPHDVSVVGFDDSWVALSVWPYLTTVHQPIEEMSYSAACLLFDVMSPGFAGETSRTLGWDLVVRDSAIPPATMAEDGSCSRHVATPAD